MWVKRIILAVNVMCGQCNLQHSINKFRFKIYRPREWKLEEYRTVARLTHVYREALARCTVQYAQSIIAPDA
jgi:hypothetical protein